MIALSLYLFIMVLLKIIIF